MLRRRRSPAKNKKGGAKGSVALLKECSQWGCVSQDAHRRKSILRKEGKLGSNHAVTFSKGTWHQEKIRETKGPSRRVIQKCEAHERSPCVTRAHKPAWDLATNINKIKNKNRASFYPPVEIKAMPAPNSKSPEEREFVVDSGASMDMLSKRDVSSEELEGVIRKGDPQESNLCTPQFEDRTQEETLPQERCACRDAWDLAKKRL